MFHHTHRLATIALGLAVTAVFAVGCSTGSPTMNGTAENPAAPDPSERLVFSGPGLGASDALGHQLFVVPDETRFAQARMVYEMAAAESGTPLRLDTADFVDYAPTTPRQVIVSGEPPAAGPDEATATGEVQLFD